MTAVWVNGCRMYVCTLGGLASQYFISSVTFFFFNFKSLLRLLQYCFCFMFWFFGQEACGILAPRPGMEATPPASEGEISTTGPLGKSPLAY